MNEPDDFEAAKDALRAAGYAVWDRPEGGLVKDDDGRYRAKHRADPAADCPDHRLRQHRDMKPPWCRSCGRNADGDVIGKVRPGTTGKK